MSSRPPVPVINGDGPRSEDVPLTGPPTTTTLYVTWTAEARTDVDTFMLGLDKCYTSVGKANARVELLGRCNAASPTRGERKIVRLHEQTGCMSVTLLKGEAPRPRFLALATEVTMFGEGLRESQGNVSPGKFVKEEFGLYFADMERDVTDQVWVVAVNDPKQATSRFAASRPSVGIRSNGLLSDSTLTPSPNSDFAHFRTNWSIDSVHATSDEALTHAKAAWNRHFPGSRCRKLREHWGFARYAFRPTYQNHQSSSFHIGLGVRVERVRVVADDELLSEHVCAGLADARGKRFVPLRGEMLLSGLSYEKRGGFAAQVEQELQALRTELEEILGRRLAYDDLPKMLRLQYESNMRAVGESYDATRYVANMRGKKKGRYRPIDLEGNLYHALLHHEKSDRTVATKGVDGKRRLKKLTKAAPGHPRRRSDKALLEAVMSSSTPTPMLQADGRSARVVISPKTACDSLEVQALHPDRGARAVSGAKSTAHDKEPSGVPGPFFQDAPSSPSQTEPVRARLETNDKLAAAVLSTPSDDKATEAQTQPLEDMSESKGLTRSSSTTKARSFVEKLGRNTSASFRRFMALD